MTALYQTILVSVKLQKYVKIESALVCYKVRYSTYSIMMNKRQAKQQQEAKKP